MTKKKHPCPQCGDTKNVVEIAYGYPGGKLVEMYRQGKVKLGVCVVTGNDPDLYSKKCKKEFFRHGQVMRNTGEHQKKNIKIIWCSFGVFFDSKIKRT